MVARDFDQYLFFYEFLNAFIESFGKKLTGKGLMLCVCVLKYLLIEDMPSGYIYSTLTARCTSCAVKSASMANSTLLLSLFITS